MTTCLAILNSTVSIVRNGPQRVSFRFIADCFDYSDWCNSGIVGRGVLLDWPRWLKATGQPPVSPVASHGIKATLPNVGESLECLGS